MKNLPIVDLFVSIQGEGKRAGIPSIFIRVSGCNLRCVFQNSICDTAYASFKPEAGKYSAADIINFIKKHPQINDIVITGGEPLMYRESLDALIDEINSTFSERHYFTIETNGTLPPLESYIDLYSISPKLINSMPHVGYNNNGLEVTQERWNELNKHRTNYNNMSDILLNVIDDNADFQLKFVYSKELDTEIVREIKNIVSYIENAVKDNFFQHTTFELDSSYVMLMPEGMTDVRLQANRKAAAELCITNGWTYTDRLHITIWGDKRGF